MAGLLERRETDYATSSSKSLKGMGNDTGIESLHRKY